jgi:hypothetical protein
VVLLRLGHVGLQHLGDDRLPRPVPDLDRRVRGRRGRPDPPPRHQRPGGELLRVRPVPVGPPAGAGAPPDRRHRRPERPQAAAPRRVRLAWLTVHDGDVLRRRRAVRARRLAVRRGQRLLRGRDGRLLLVAARPGRPGRARRRLEPRLGHRLPRRRAAAGRESGALHPAREPRAHRGHGRPHLPGLGGRVVGRLHRRQRHPPAQPAAAGRRAGRAVGRRAVGRFPAARRHPQGPAPLPADAVVPGRVPDLQRRRPDDHRRLGPVRRRTSCWCRSWPSSAR